MWNDKQRKVEDRVKNNEKWKEKDRRRLSEPEDNDVFEESEEDEDDAGAHPDVQCRNVADFGSVLSGTFICFFTFRWVLNLKQRVKRIPDWLGWFL